MSRNWLMRCVLLAGFFTQQVFAIEFTVLSAGAIEPGLKKAVAAFQQETGHQAKVIFNTAPQIRKRMTEGESWDVLIAPPALLDELGQTKNSSQARVAVGRVGLGVAVRPNVALPDISTVAALQRELKSADSLVFNRASTGIYLEGLLKKMGIYPELEAKSTRYANGASVLEHVLHGKGREIGFGAITEILLYREQGLQLVGPLPPEIQNYTAYSAIPLNAQGNPELVRRFVQYLGSPAGQALFVAAGVQP